MDPKGGVQEGTYDGKLEVFPMEPVPWKGKREEKKQREREKDRGERGASAISRVPGSCVRARFNELGRISLVDNERRLDEPSSKLRLSRFFQLEPQVFRVNHRKLRGYFTFHPPQPHFRLSFRGTFASVPIFSRLVSSKQRSPSRYTWEPRCFPPSLIDSFSERAGQHPFNTLG